MSNIIANIDPNLSRQQAASTDLQAKSKQIQNLANSGQVDKDKKIRESCEGFESIFIQKMWEQMRAAIPKSGLLQSKEEHYWQSMYDHELAKKMSEAGGIGLADMMYEQLTRDLSSASQANYTRTPMEINPAPLFNSKSNNLEPQAVSTMINSADFAEKAALVSNNKAASLYEDLQVDEITIEDIELMELSLANDLLASELKNLDEQGKKQNPLEDILLTGTRLNSEQLMQVNPNLLGENLAKKLLANEIENS